MVLHLSGYEIEQKTIIIIYIYNHQRYSCHINKQAARGASNLQHLHNVIVLCIFISNLPVITSWTKVAIAIVIPPTHPPLPFLPIGKREYGGGGGIGKGGRVINYGGAVRGCAARGMGPVGSVSTCIFYAECIGPIGELKHR